MIFDTINNDLLLHSCSWKKKAQIMEFSLHKILSGKTNQLNTQAAKDDVGLQICNYCYDF